MSFNKDYAMNVRVIGYALTVSISGFPCYHILFSAAVIHQYNPSQKPYITGPGYYTVRAFCQAEGLQYDF